MVTGEGEAGIAFPAQVEIPGLGEPYGAELAPRAEKQATPLLHLHSASLLWGSTTPSRLQDITSGRRDKGCCCCCCANQAVPRWQGGKGSRGGLSRGGGGDLTQGWPSAQSEVGQAAGISARMERQLGQKEEAEKGSAGEAEREVRVVCPTCQRERAENGGSDGFWRSGDGGATTGGRGQFCHPFCLVPQGICPLTHARTHTLAHHWVQGPKGLGTTALLKVPGCNSDHWPHGEVGS